jgi:hypothetical protein
MVAAKVAVQMLHTQGHITLSSTYVRYSHTNVTIVYVCSMYAYVRYSYKSTLHTVSGECLSGFGREVSAHVHLVHVVQHRPDARVLLHQTELVGGLGQSARQASAVLLNSR